MTHEEAMWLRCVRALVGSIFAAWYLWGLAWHPEPELVVIAATLTVVLVVASAKAPWSVLMWLPVCIMMFNQVHRWLPWPSVKAAYVAPAVLCCIAGFSPPPWASSWPPWPTTSISPRTKVPG